MKPVGKLLRRTYVPETWAAPAYARFADRNSDHINAELRRDDAWLPVTHTDSEYIGQEDGVWFYYARGCSEMMWNAGRTFAAKDRLHATHGLLRNATCGYACARRILEAWLHHKSPEPPSEGALTPCRLPQ